MKKITFIVLVSLSIFLTGLMTSGSVIASPCHVDCRCVTCSENGNGCVNCKDGCKDCNQCCDKVKLTPKHECNHCDKPVETKNEVK